MSRLRTLKPEQDAFGQMLWNYYKGKDACEIVERDDGFFSARPENPKMYFSDYEDWPSIEQKAMQSVRGNVLDIGCGAGRHSLYLQKKGFNVVGIDSSPLAIKVCRLRGLKKAWVVPIEDIAFKSDSFDTIMLLGGNFGLLGNPRKARRLLKRFDKITGRNAVILAETRDPYKTSNPEHLDYHRRNGERGRLSGQMKIRARFEKAVTKWFDWLIVSKEEMKELLRGTGWKVREFIDSEDSAYPAIIEKKA